MFRTSWITATHRPDRRFQPASANGEWRLSDVLRELRVRNPGLPRADDPRLLGFNFTHLFSMSLLPLSTAWMAVSHLAPEPVSFYAAVFFLVNATYMGLIWELVDRSRVDEISPTVRRIMRFRSITTLSLFGMAALLALKYPLVGLGICICCLILYLKPDPARAGN